MLMPGLPRQRQAPPRFGNHLLTIAEISHSNFGNHPLGVRLASISVEFH